MTLKKLLKKRPECGEYRVKGIRPVDLYRGVEDIQSACFSPFKSKVFYYTLTAREMMAPECYQIIHVSDENKQILLMEGKFNG